jgi:uncharacterized protein YdiU (UPF0061 family)
MFNFHNTYRMLPDVLYSVLDPIPVKKPGLVILNETLAEKLSIDENNLHLYLSGNDIPVGAEPIAQANAGHQYGYFTMLGDGRAILLGEHSDEHGNKYDIQLKGSGITPYSRDGDGRATLYSMLREYVISEAMFFLKIPTTRSLAVVATGEPVYRERIEKGAVLTRVAKSHIRVGTFQYVAMQKDVKLLKLFTDYVIDHHYPDLHSEKNPYAALIRTVMERQIDLIVDWLRVGFIHGVMNTDNMSISCETIDYGPCAFMDTYNPMTVFSSIDHYGRYSFENQKGIGGWNIARFSETLVPLIDSSETEAVNIINKILSEYQELFTQKYNAMMCQKIGIENPDSDDVKLFTDLLNSMNNEKLDYTTTFRNLKSESEPKLEKWYSQWKRHKIDYDLMDRVNPAVIPRNHIVELALKEASRNDNLELLNKLLNVLTTPYDDTADGYYRNPPEVVDYSYKTYCGT